MNAGTLKFGSCTRRMVEVEKIHFNCFLCPSLHTECSTHLVILNSDSFNAKLTASMWSKCILKVCADGGANRLFDSLSPETRADCIPNYIVGDLDSLRPEVKEYYENRGTQVKKLASQDENDLDKAVMFIRSVLEAGAATHVQSKEELPENTVVLQSSGEVRSVEVVDGASASSKSESIEPIESAQIVANSSITPAWNCTIVLMGAYGGRFDQEMAAVSSMYRWLNVFDRFVLLGSHACSFLLQPGYTHKIRPVHPLHLAHHTGTMYATEGPTCGLIPIGGKVNSLTSSGLQWDMHEATLQLGALISSSNHIPPNVSEVTVVTSDTVLWTVQMHVL